MKKHSWTKTYEQANMSTLWNPKTNASAKNWKRNKYENKPISKITIDTHARMIWAGGCGPCEDTAVATAAPSLYCLANKETKETNIQKIKQASKSGQELRANKSMQTKNKYEETEQWLANKSEQTNLRQKSSRTNMWNYQGLKCTTPNKEEHGNVNGQKAKTR